MALWKTRICSTCGKGDFTASPSPVCAPCAKDAQRQESIKTERQRILLCYGNVEGPSLNEHMQRCYTFTHSCGEKQTWAFHNLLKQWKTRPEPCKKCGGKDRQQKAMAGYVAKFQLSERARTDLHAYTRKVRGLSEATYHQHIDVLNPKRLPRKRGNQGYHLDHIVSIVECFRQGWSPEKAAALDNLQLLEARDNLSKGR